MSASERHRSLPLGTTHGQAHDQEPATGPLSDNGTHPATVANPVGIAGRPKHTRHGMDLSDIFQRHTAAAAAPGAPASARALADVSLSSRSGINTALNLAGEGSSNVNGNANGNVSVTDIGIGDNTIAATLRRVHTLVAQNANATSRQLATIFNDAAERIKGTSLSEFLNNQRASRKSVTLNPFGNQTFEERAHQALAFDENNENVKTNESTSAPMRAAHFRSFPRTSPSLLYRPEQTQNVRGGARTLTQTVLSDALSPSVIGPTNIRVVTTEERERRDHELRDALKTISLSMEPPPHNVDVGRLWLLETIKESNGEQSPLYVVLDFLMGTPFELVRAVWHYVILEIHLAYSLALLYVSFFTTPPLIFFIIGLTLFWMKIIYEIYRDIMHRDDPNYTSNVPKEMSIAAAISASMGFVLNVKAQSGDITDAWWRGEDE